jgi:hypothetical protein
MLLNLCLTSIYLLFGTFRYFLIFIGEIIVSVYLSSHLTVLVL